MSLVKSMTGYGRAVETVNGREFTVELRSVNNRYLDCTVKLPRSLSFGEDAVKQAVKNAISRGKVDVFLSVRSEGAADVKVTLNESMVAGYLAAMKQMAENFDVKEDISVSLLSRMPDVFTVEKPEVDEQQLLDDMLSVVNKAAGRLRRHAYHGGQGAGERSAQPGTDDPVAGQSGGSGRRPDCAGLPHPSGK